MYTHTYIYISIYVVFIMCVFVFWMVRGVGVDGRLLEGLLVMCGRLTYAINVHKCVLGSFL